MTSWQPIDTYQFPWEPYELLVAAKHKDDGEVEVFLCRCSKGEFYPGDSIMALSEDGWIPFAWSPDVPPKQAP